MCRVRHGFGSARRDVVMPKGMLMGFHGIAVSERVCMQCSSRMLRSMTLDRYLWHQRTNRRGHRSCFCDECDVAVSWDEVRRGSLHYCRTCWTILCFQCAPPPEEERVARLQAAVKRARLSRASASSSVGLENVPRVTTLAEFRAASQDAGRR